MHVWFSSIWTRVQTAKYHKLHIFIVEGDMQSQKIGLKMTSYIAVGVTAVAGAYMQSLLQILSMLTRL
jgi:hypothetical protein